ncbi:hypothetical protein [Carnobacterium sp. TMP28]|jgi:hypothetical protein|uniref:hypothetical protein n=1 Tax=Carnobacterium sp. TMP28 TaxID=3397060 RepID=UPI0039DF3A4D
MDKKMFYILMPIYLIPLLFISFFVPNYFSETFFLLGWLLLTSIISLLIKGAFVYRKKKKQR